MNKISARIEVVDKLTGKKMVRLILPLESILVGLDDVATIINVLREVQKELPASINGDWREWQHEGD